MQKLKSSKVNSDSRSHKQSKQK